MPDRSDLRASPDALLALANKERRGQLKIFLGAAPGVGKTFAMLMAARSARDEGRDVVAGLIETHGRQETEAILADFEILPRKPIIYRNQVIQEFDIDAALLRRPGLILIDEYAHTNVPGSRHPKRWQDIAELLNKGTDVWTTLNIQHLEGLNDVIQKITQVRVRETIPDAEFDKADELILVDLPPDELLKRLAAGKIYVADTAARAIESFFKPQNLIALRELALRRAAERIDADLLSRMQAHAIEGPWAAGERIMACVGADANAAAIVRTAKRLADLMDAPWIAVNVERPGHAFDDERRRRIDDALELARSLGGSTKTLVGNDLPAEILKFGGIENVTQIVIGRSHAGLLSRLLGYSLQDEVIRRARDIAVHVVTDAPASSPPRSWRPFRFTSRLLTYLWSTLGVGAATLIGQVLGALTPLPNLSMVFLVAVLLPAVNFGIGPAIYASVLSFLAYNYFFIEPIHSFTIAEPYEFLALLIFLAVAVITSTLAGRVKTQMKTAADRVRATRRLYEFTRRLSGLVSIDDVAEAAASEIHHSLGLPAIILLDTNDELKLVAAWPPEDTIDTASQSAARWAFEHNEPAGHNTATLPLIPWLFLPLKASRGRLGVVGITPQNARAMDSEVHVLFETLVEQTAAAVERTVLSRNIVAAQTAVEAERVRNTVLASISHDFRTPLATILGAATSLIDYGAKIGTTAHNELLGQIKEEAEHLDTMVRNLLSMTRIDAGALELHQDWIDLGEIVNRVVSAARRRGAQQNFATHLPNDLPLVKADAILVEQAISNVIGNAIDHTPDTTHISIGAASSAKTIAITIDDDGPGIAPDVLPRVFEKFVSTAPRSRAHGGKGDRTGLGLAIAKGIMEAHGGEITAHSPTSPRGGTHVVMIFKRDEVAT